MSSPFRELGLASDLVAHLTAQGITEPSPIQAATMAELLAGRDVVAAAPTGSGKTLAFAAPLVARLGKGAPYRPAALVLTPTRELAAQIHQVLQGLCRVRGLFASTVYGGVKQGPQVSYLRKGVDVLVACPGRLEDLIEQGYVHLDKVSIVVIDEADRMADMGFLPCVRRIVDQTHPDRQTMLFSATLDGAADGLARTHLKDPAKHAVAPKEEDQGKATHLFWTSSTDQRAQLSAEIIRKAGRTVVFTRTKHGADRLTERLNAMGVQAAVIHGGCSQAARDRSLADFHRGKVAALVATDVAARGIHVEKVACVVHHDLPDSPTDYQHRSGRTARAGERGTVVSLVTPDQRRHAKSVQRHFGFPHGHSAPNLDHIEAGEVPVVVERVAGDRYERGERTERPAYAGRNERPGYAGRNERPGYAGRSDRSTTDRPGYAGRTDRPGYAGRDDRPAPARDDRPGYAGRSDRPGYAGRTDRPGYADRDGRPAPARDDRPGYAGRPGSPARYGKAAPAAGRTDRPGYAGRDGSPARYGNSAPAGGRSDRPRPGAGPGRPARTGR
jgi:superfamily II DNA/RNA helicase